MAMFFMVMMTILIKKPIPVNIHHPNSQIRVLDTLPRTKILNPKSHGGRSKMSFLFIGVTFRFNHIFQGCRFQQKTLGHILDAFHAKQHKKYKRHIPESLILDGKKHVLMMPFFLPLNLPTWCSPRTWCANIVNGPKPLGSFKSSCFTSRSLVSHKKPVGEGFLFGWWMVELKNTQPYKKGHDHIISLVNPGCKFQLL